MMFQNAPTPTPTASNPFDQFDDHAGAPQRVPARILGPPKTQDPLDRQYQEGQIEAQQRAAAAAAQEAQLRDAQLAAAEQKKKQIAAGGGVESSVEQAKAAGFYNRAQRSAQMYEQTGVGPRGYLEQQAASAAPGLMNNFVDSSKRQVSEAAMRDFVAATLRYESGAAIPPSELETQRKIFFPAPGDTPETIAAKATLRANAIESLRIGAGPAAALSPPVQKNQTFGAGATAEDIAADRLPSPPRLPLTDPMSDRATFDAAVGDQGDPTVAGDITKDTDLAFSTPSDLKIAADTTAIFNSGGDSRQKLDAYADANHLPRLGPELDDAIRARAQGGTVTFTPRKTGHKSLGPLEGGLSQVAGSTFGSAVTGAANGITAGNIDEITGAVNAGLKGTSLADEIAQANYKKQLIANAHPVANMLGEIGGSLLGAKGIGMGLEGTRIAALAARAPAAVDAGYGALYGAGENNDNRVGGALSGALISPAAGALGRSGVKALGSVIAPTGGALRPLYDAGVRPTLGQRMVDKPFIGPAINTAEEALGSIPLLGSAVRGARQEARDQFQTGAFNSALKEIGDELPKGMKPGTDPHAYAQKAFSQAYDKARTGLQFVGDKEFIDGFKALSKEVLDGGLEETSANRFKRIVIGNVERRLRGGNMADGGALKDMQSALGKRIADIRNSPSGDHELAGALEDLSTLIDDAARRNSTPAAVAALDAADKGYAKLVRIETASQGAGEAGKFTPLQFDNAVKKASGGRAARSKAYQRGDALMQDYATAGRNLTDRLPNSGTADRIAMGSVLGGSGALVSPGIPVGAALATAPYLPGVRKLTTALAAPRGDGPLGRILNSVGSTVKKGSTVGGKITRQAALNKYGQGTR